MYKTLKLGKGKGLRFFFFSLGIWISISPYKVFNTLETVQFLMFTGKESKITEANQEEEQLNCHYM